MYIFENSNVDLGEFGSQEKGLRESTQVNIIFKVRNKREILSIT